MKEIRQMSAAGKGALVTVVASLLATPVRAKVDLVTLPARDRVQLTIYNSADLTLVRDQRTLTVRQGQNRLQFSWANTLIDPTSLDLLPRAYADRLDIAALVYPPRTRQLGVWNIVSRHAGPVPVEIAYLASGFSWRAFYMGTLSADERTMRLEGYVRVTNQSGEDYENAEVRLIVGQVHILDEIAALARREHPYGRPPLPRPIGRMEEGIAREVGGRDSDSGLKAAMVQRAMVAAAAPKEIIKEGLSEYFLYTIEGTETIPHGWSKRLPSFTAEGVPVMNLYRHDEERFGPQVIRFLSFKNDKAHRLGETPIPGGMLRVFRLADRQGALSYEGQSDFKYIPVDEDVELNLGAMETVMVEPKEMDFRTDNYLFDQNGDIAGWDETREWKVEVRNARPLRVRMELHRHFGTPHWELVNRGDVGAFEKVDLDTVKYTLEMEPVSKRTISYRVTTRHGRRAEEMGEAAGTVRSER